MNQCLIDMVDSVDGGVCQSIDELVKEFLSCDLEDLSKEQCAYIDEHIFTCDTCNWTMPIDEMSECEESDGFLCRECEDD